MKRTTNILWRMLGMVLVLAMIWGMISVAAMGVFIVLERQEAVR